ncbi:MAG: class I SAM-dependent rRNA methyltransferase [Bacteroidaceae bacterium]|nr:class I SAM-dependent rRNA methyltransferase [Bacteroidaceae bacterium]
MKSIQLLKGKTESLLRFHPWIFSGAIKAADEDIAEGELVRVLDHTGKFIALGHYQVGSIAVRVISFKDEKINQAFWVQRLIDAYELRKSCHLTRADNTIYRLVHGEGDNLPGLVVDVYGETAVMQAHAVSMHHNRQVIAQAIVEATQGAVKNVYYKSETTLPFKANLGQENGFLIGSDASEIAIENGLAFHIDWLRGQKTGFFIDQRENRSLLEFYSKNKRVLNMFCYTGGFSVYAMRGGATCVHSVDSSSKAIDLTNANIQLNFPGDERHQAFTEDAFKFLEHSASDYDVVILDPPAFAKHKHALHNALKGYTRLNKIAISKIKKGGIIFTFSCSQAVNKDQFRLAVFSAAAQCGRHVRIIHQLHQPADHPVNIYHPEGEYLKGLVIQVE